MITIRNPDACQSRTVIAGEAMTVGQVVYLAQAATKGDPCKVMLAGATELGDPTVVKGVVAFVPDDSEAVDFTISTDGLDTLTVNAGSDGTTAIALGALCTFWYDKPVIGFHSSAVDAALDFAVIREGGKVAFDGDSSKLADYNAGGVDGTEDFMGVVYQHEGAEITVAFTSI